MADATQYISPFTPNFDDDGNLLVEGFLSFFERGTMDPKDTFPTQSTTATDPNDELIPLDGAGRPIVPIFTEGVYKVVQYNAALEIVGEIDPYVTPPESAFVDYEEGVTYDKGDKVRSAVNTFLYISLKDSNTTNPIIEPNADWTRYRLIRAWNSLETYDDESVVVYTDGLLYVSLGDGNINNIPDEVPASWKPQFETGGTPLIDSGVLTILAPGSTTVEVTGLAFIPTKLDAFSTGPNDVISSGFTDGVTSSEAFLNISTTPTAGVTSELSPGITLASFETNGFILNVGPLTDTLYLQWTAYA